MVTLVQILIFLIKIIFDVFIYILILRLLLQKLSASWNNPVTQMTIRLTRPLLRPIRKIIPGFKGFDFAILVLAFVVALLRLVIVWLLSYSMLPGVVGLILLSIITLIVKTLNLFIFAIIISAIISWFPKLQGGPLSQIAWLISEPCLKLPRRFIPVVGGFDLSPLVAIIVLYLISSLIIPPLMEWTIRFSF
ncbi:MAG: YggT family protein [Gammaproteobacteria bacterium]|nr:YggT family protein [Gammaproteobacteria bacterium]